MKIEVEKNLQNRFKFDFEKNIKIIVQKIPKEHIIYLDKIQILYLSPEKHQKDAYGFYYGKREGEDLPKIIISAKNVFNSLPKAIFYFPFLPRLFLAQTIYHEVGHHYQRLHHGIRKGKWERNADLYKDRMMKKAFGVHILFFKVLFFPLLCVRILLKKIGKW